MNIFKILIKYILRYIAITIAQQTFILIRVIVTIILKVLAIQFIKRKLQGHRHQTNQ